MNGKVLLASRGTFAPPFVTATAELYDPAAGVWTLTGSLAVGKNGATATSLANGTVLFAGGDDGMGVSEECELYHPTTGQWTQTRNLQKGRETHQATILSNGQLLVVGGITKRDQRIGSTEVYDPVRGKWNMRGNLATVEDRNMLNLLPSGEILVAGGENDKSNFTKIAQLGTPLPGN